MRVAIVQRGVGDGGVERLRVVGPGQHVLLAARSLVPKCSCSASDVRQLLARMGDRLHVDHRHRRVLRERCEHAVLAVDRPVARTSGTRARRSGRRSATARAPPPRCAPRCRRPSRRRSNSIGHASLPGCSTTAWPPSWKAPSSKLVRVRSDGLKNTSAIDLPLQLVAELRRLNRAASASSASSSARVQSWVLRKCFMGSPGRIRRARKRKNPARWLGSESAPYRRSAALPSRVAGAVGGHARSCPPPCRRR